MQKRKRGGVRRKTGKLNKENHDESSEDNEATVKK